jgi:signal transduction histidine kinase
MDTPTTNEPDELSRIVEIGDLDLDYSETQAFLGNLTKLAAGIAGTSISLINLIDLYTQWTISSFGLRIEQMPREDSVCQYTIKGEGPFEVRDLSADERFSGKFYVTGPEKLRYYYGIPLQTAQGNNIGALCFLDERRREISPEKEKLLKILADEIVNRLMIHKTLGLLQDGAKSALRTQKQLVHDIRGPLGGIIGLADMIADGGSEGNPEETQELIGLIQKSGREILDLADSILEKHAEESDSQAKASFTLGEFGGRLERIFMPQALSKKVSLVISVGEEGKPIPVPKCKLLQIAGNLISNALKFTPENGIVTVDLDYLRDETRPLLRILVKDTGVGMDQAGLNAILQGTSESSAGTEGETGYGFGLQLIRHLVSDLDGIMTMDSIPGKGTAFRVELPQEAKRLG